MRRFKYAETGLLPRIPVRIGLTGPSDPIDMLLGSLPYSGPPSGYLFRDRSKSKAASSGPSRIFVTGRYCGPCPCRTQVHPQSLRSGGISAAYAAGLPLELIMRLTNHSDKKVVRRRYPDPKTPASDEGRLFLGGFWCKVLRLDSFCPVVPSVAYMECGHKRRDYVERLKRNLNWVSSSLF